MTASPFDSWSVSPTSAIPSCGATVTMSSLWKERTAARTEDAERGHMTGALPFLGGQLCSNQHRLRLLLNRTEVIDWLWYGDNHDLTHPRFRVGPRRRRRKKTKQNSHHKTEKMSKTLNPRGQFVGSVGSTVKVSSWNKKWEWKKCKNQVHEGTETCLFIVEFQGDLNLFLEFNGSNCSTAFRFKWNIVVVVFFFIF